MAIDIELDMSVDPENEISMTVDDGDEVEIGVGEAIVVKDHAILDNRDLPDQHPISAITGLEDALANIDTMMLVTITGASDNLTADKTYAEIQEAMPNVIAKWDYSYYSLSRYKNTGAAYEKYIDFSRISLTPSDANNSIIKVRGNNRVELYSDILTVPTATSSLINDSGYITENEVPKELFVVIFFLTGTDPLTVTTTTTAYEVAQAVQSGKALYAVIIAGQLGFANLTPTTLISDNGDVSVGFTFNEQGSNLMGVRYFEIHMLNDAQPIVTNIKTDPFATTEDVETIIDRDVDDTYIINQLGYTPVNPSSLATVATTGSYNDLTDKPDLSVYMQKGVDYVTAGKLSGTTLGSKATAEGENTTASSSQAHAEGNTTKATGLISHAEGYGGTASGNYSHAEGYYSNATGSGSHAEGRSTASGNRSHSEGSDTTAQGDTSHAEGLGTKANRKSQHVFGEYNLNDNTGADKTVRGAYVEIVGNGADANNRSNARTLDWSGNEVLAGTLTVGANPTNNMEVATKQYVDGAIPTVPTNVSAFTNDAGYLVASDLVAITTAEIDALFV